MSETQLSVKQCSVCRESKTTGCFHRDKKGKQGVASRCKECNKEITAEWYQSNKKQQKSKNIGRKAKKRYGLTLEQAELYWYSECCSCCESEDPGFRGKFYIDHDHATGNVRGALCLYCNSGIGYFRDSPELLAKAISYLEKYGNVKANS